MIYRGSGFLAVVLFDSSPIPFPTLLSIVGSTGDLQQDEKEKQLADERGREGIQESLNDF